MKWDSSWNYWTAQRDPWSVCMWPWMATPRCSRLVPDCCDPRDRDTNTWVGKRDVWRDRRFPDGQRAAGMQRVLGAGRDHKDHPVKMRMGKRDPGQGRCHGYRHCWQIGRLSQGGRCLRGMWLRGNISHPGPCRRFLRTAPGWASRAGPPTEHPGQREGSEQQRWPQRHGNLACPRLKPLCYSCSICGNTRTTNTCFSCEKGKQFSSCLLPANGHERFLAEQGRDAGATVNEKWHCGEFLIPSDTLALDSADLGLRLLFSPSSGTGPAWHWSISADVT